MNRTFQRFVAVLMALCMALSALPALAEPVETIVPAETIVPLATEGTQAILETNALETKKAEAPAPETTKTAAPETTETAAPETTETAAPEATKTAAPETTETAAPEATETAAPETTETAAPETTETAAPEAPAVNAPALLTAGEALNGTTEKVDASTTLADGEYTPESFSFSGGTGKTKITCEKVTVADGKAAATIVFSSSKYGYVKANDKQYNVLSADEKGSRFEFPVDLNVENTIIGMTTAMEEAHEIEYKITITLAEPEATPTPAATEAPAREDGDYTPDTSATSDLAMMNITATKVRVVNGKIMVTIVTEPTASQAANGKKASYTKIYLGSRRDDGVYEDNIVDGVANDKNGYDFTFEVKEEQLGKTIDFVGYTTKWSPSKNQYHITLPSKITKVQPTPAPTETPAGREDGDYTINVESSYSMFKITSQSAKVVDGKICVTLSTSKKTYDKIYLGSKNDEANYPNYIQGTANATGGYDFTFELDEALLGTTTDFVPGKPNGTWYSKNQYQLTFPADLEKAGEPTPAPTETPAAPMFEIKAVYVVKQADGSYEVTVLSDDANYDRMYVGSLADAAAAAMVMKKTSGGQGFYRLTAKPEQLVDGVYIPLVAGNARGQWFDFRKDVLSTNDPSEVPALPEDAVSKFNVVSVSAAKEGDLLKVVLVSDSADYDRVFIGLTGTYTKSPYYMRQTMADGKFCYVFTLPQSCLGTPVKFVPGKADGTWYTDEQLTFTCTEAALPETPAAAKPADGDYTAPSAVYVDRGDKGVQNNGTFEALYTEVTVSGDTLKVTVWNRSTGWNAIHLGKVSDENKTAIERVEEKGKYKDAYYRYDFTLPASALGTVISFVPRDTKKGTWSASQYYLAISDQLTAAKTVEPEPSETPAPSGTLTDGEYTMDVDSSASMFRVVACKLIAKNGKYSAVITLSGTGYDKLFMGTAEDAAKTDASKHIPFKADADGRYTYELPDVQLDTPVSVAAHSTKNDKW